MTDTPTEETQAVDALEHIARARAEQILTVLDLEGEEIAMEMMLAIHGIVASAQRDSIAAVLTDAVAGAIKLPGAFQAGGPSNPPGTGPFAKTEAGGVRFTP